MFMYLHPSKQICRYISGFKIILVCYPATTEFVTGQVKLLFYCPSYNLPDYSQNRQNNHREVDFEMISL